MKWLILGFAIVAFLTIASIFGSIYIPRWLAPERGKTEEVIITNRGQYRIQAYERFYQINEELVAVDNKLGVYSFSAPNNLRQETECKGMLFKRANLVSEYNAKSQQERTTAKWQDPSLPERLYNRDDIATLCNTLPSRV